MIFDPPDEPVDPVVWKASPELIRLAMRRCDWVNCDQINELHGEEWGRTIIVSCYYQGLADGIKHMARKQRVKEKAK